MRSSIFKLNLQTDQADDHPGEDGVQDRVQPGRAADQGHGQVQHGPGGNEVRLQGSVEFPVPEAGRQPQD